MGLLSAHDHDDELSAISEPERLCVGVIMKEPGPIAAWGEIVYMLKELEGVREPMEWCEGMFMPSMDS